MSERIVDVFETVKVQKQNREQRCRIALQTSERLLQSVHEKRAIGKPGQPVVQRVVQQTLLVVARGRDVLDGAFVVSDGAVFVAHHARVLRNPNQIAALAPNLRLEIRNFVGLCH